MSTDDLYVVLGATGGTGRALVREAIRRGHRVRAVSRAATAAGGHPAQVQVLDADVSTDEGAAAAVAGAGVVLHAAQPAYPHWPREFPGPDCHDRGRHDDRWRHAGPGRQPLHVRATACRHADDRADAAAAADRTGTVRAAMATDLLARHTRGDLRVTLGRASDYYGPHGTGSALGDSVVGAAVRGRPARVTRSVDMPHTMSYLPDLAAGLLILAERDPADGRAWHLPAAEPLTMREFTDLVADAVGRPVPLRASSPRTLRVLGLGVPMLRELAAISYQWQEPFVSDDSAFRLAFPDAVQVTDHSTAIATTVSWFRENSAAESS